MGCLLRTVLEVQFECTALCMSLLLLVAPERGAGFEPGLQLRCCFRRLGGRAAAAAGGMRQRLVLWRWYAAVVC